MKTACVNQRRRHPCISSGSVKSRQLGLTLLELMISLSLGMLLLVGIGTVYVGSNQTYRVQEQNARIQESGRYALDIIGRSLRRAGYWDTLANPVALPGFIGTPIAGTNGAGTAADTVTVQYDGVIGDRDCQGNNVTATMQVQDAFQLDAANFELECDGNAEAGGAIVNPQPLVSNVEDLQILYGIDTDADQSANQYTAAPGNWNQVVSVRACVLIRSEEQGITTAGQANVSCGVALGTAVSSAAVADTRLRRTFVATFNLRNRVTRLP